MKRSKEHNAAIAASLTGRKLSEETKNKMAASHRVYRKLDLVEYMLYLSKKKEGDEDEATNVDIS